MASITGSTTSTDIICGVTGMDGNYAYRRDFDFSCNGVSKHVFSPPKSSFSPNVVFDGLESSTTYTVYCTITLGDSNATIDLSAKFTTTAPENPKPDNPTGYVLASLKSYTYIDFYFGECENADGYTLQYRKSTETAWTSIDCGDSTSGTIEGLKVGTQYKLRYYAYNETGDSEYSPESTATTKNIPPFSWGDISSGGDFNISASDWNDFYETVNLVRSLNNMSEVSFTTATSGGELTATAFLKVANALDGLNCGVAPQCTNTSYIYTGADIYAWYFTNLETALNSAINNLK